MQKKMFLFVSCFMVLSLFAVYGGGNKQSGSASASGKPEITITMLDRGWVPASEGSYEDNRWTRWINENSPVRVKWVPVLRTEATQRINALFAAGSAPDLVIEYGRGFMDNLYNQGVIQPVGDYIEKYSTSYKQYLKEHPELMPFVVADDGKQYGMTSLRGILDLQIQSMYIRQDWLKKFGMQKPATVNELLTFMRRVRDEDPDGNGVKDTYGLAFSQLYLGLLRTMFGAPYGDFEIQNGHFVDWTATQAYQDYMTFMNLIYKEGLIDPEYITDTQSARQRQLWVTGKAGVYLGSRTFENEWRELLQNVPTAEMLMIDLPASSYGQFDYQWQDAARYMICMNKNAKNPQAIMAFLDWMITDGWWTLTFGEEGRHYRLVNGVPQAIDAEINRVETAYLQEYTPVSQYSPAPNWFKVLAPSDTLSQTFAGYMEEYYTRVAKDKPKRFVAYTPTSDAIRAYNTETSAQISALETNIITGTVSVAEGIRQLTALKNTAGWAAVNAEKEAWYQKNKHLFTVYN